jgi:hypothetical protein
MILFKMASANKNKIRKRGRFHSPRFSIKGKTVMKIRSFMKGTTILYPKIY